jgi:hypothetical protein
LVLVDFLRIGCEIGVVGGVESSCGGSGSIIGGDGEEEVGGIGLLAVQVSEEK